MYSAARHPAASPNETALILCDRKYSLSLFALSGSLLITYNIVSLDNIEGPSRECGLNSIIVGYRVRPAFQCHISVAIGETQDDIFFANTDIFEWRELSPRTPRVFPVEQFLPRRPSKRP